MCINCCGLKSKLNYPEFNELIAKNDIACFTETKTDDMDEIKLKGYKFIIKNRRTISKIKSGGIILGYKEQFQDFIEAIDTDCKFVLWCSFKNNLPKGRRNFRHNLYSIRVYFILLSECNQRN